MPRASPARPWQRVLDLRIPHRASQTSGQIIVSIGVASIPGITGSSELTFIEAADAALYRAKADGRALIRS